MNPKPSIQIMKDLESKISWVNKVNARSSKDVKSYQQELAAAINREVPHQSAPTNMSIAAPMSFGVVTKSGSMSRRHFVGGDQLILKQAIITQRTYKLLLEFHLVDASDIDVIRVPLNEALNSISGFEIRMLASPGVMQLVNNVAIATQNNKVEKEAEKFSSKYDTIGFGSW